METTCGICQDTISEATKIVECGHIFCFSCIGKWSNVSNSCPLCQKRFLQLSRLAHGKVHPVKPIDRREENWMEVMEEYDSEELSIHTEDDEEEEEELGSEGDRYEEDFVLPDNVIYYENGMVRDLRDSMKTLNPFGKTPKGQKDSTITCQDGTVIKISWPSEDSEESEYEPSFEEEDDE